MKTGLPAQFVNWKLEHREGDPKPTKVPCNAFGQKINHLDPTNWTDEATAAARGVDGLGVAFVFMEHDPFFLIDVDDCRDAETGVWDEDAIFVGQTFPGAYMEISQSGKGLHIIARCDQTISPGLRNKWGGKFEFYTKGRFVALTYTAASGSVDLDFTFPVMSYVPTRPDPALTGVPDTGPVPEWNGHTDDVMLVQHALEARGSIDVQFGKHAPFRALWMGDVVALAKHYRPIDKTEPFDRSAADAALVMHLGFWTGKDAARTERLWLASPLAQSRPDQKKLRRAYYLNRTVTSTLTMIKAVYVRPADAQPLPDAITAPPAALTGTLGAFVGAALPGTTGQAPGGYLTTPEVQRHFDGFVYVIEDNKILTPLHGLLDKDRFINTYGGYEFQMQADGSRPSRNPWEAFTQNRSHRFPQVARRRYLPDRAFGEIVNNEINVFQMPVVDKTEGDVTPYLKLLAKILPNENDRSILLAWMAAMVQNPGVKFQWAVAIQGVEGNGKTFILTCLERAVGQSVTHWPNPEDLNEKYNDYIEGNLLIGVEEIHMEGRRDVLDRLKKYITGARLEVRAMREDKRMADNLTNWFFLTNYQNAVLKSRNDRRYAVFFSAQQHKPDLERDGMTGTYFPSLWKWAREGGFAAVAGYLQRYAIPAHLNPAGECHRAPDTSSIGAAIHQSLGFIEQEILDAVESDMIGFRGGWISTAKARDLLDARRKTISNNGLGDALRALGYVQCPTWPKGRAPTVIMQETGRRPILYCTEDLAATNPPFEVYMRSQGYEAPQLRVV